MSDVRERHKVARIESTKRELFEALAHVMTWIETPASGMTRDHWRGLDRAREVYRRNHAAGRMGMAGPNS